MKCNRCGAELLKSDFCPECRADVSFYKKAAMASNAYYNKGLEQAKVRNISGAIETLKQALMFDKTNTTARNLLGLCYYELGEVVDALSCWIISKKFQPDANIAVDYVDQLKKKRTDFDENCVAARKYNRALENAKEGNLDVSLIQVKKIVSTCPRFIKAQLLLALFYIEKRAYGRADKCVKAVLSVDNGNTTAYRYLNEINLYRDTFESQPTPISMLFKKGDSEEEVQERKPLSGNEVIIPKSEYKGSGNGFFSLLNILIGIGIGAAIIFFLAVPAAKSAAVKEATGTDANTIAQLSETTAKLEEMTKKVEQLEAEKNATTDTQTQTGTVTTGDDVSKLITASKYYINGDKASCAETLAGVNTDNLTDADSKELYNMLSSTMEDQAGDTFDQAMSYFEDGDYEEAAKEFLLCYSYDTESENSLYYAALSYDYIGDTENAKRCYQKIITNFPNGNHIDEATEYVNG